MADQQGERISGSAASVRNHNGRFPQHSRPRAGQGQVGHRGAAPRQGLGQDQPIQVREFQPDSDLNWAKARQTPHVETGTTKVPIQESQHRTETLDKTDDQKESELTRPNRRRVAAKADLKAKISDVRKRLTVGAEQELCREVLDYFGPGMEPLHALLLGLDSSGKTALVELMEKAITHRFMSRSTLAGCTTRHVTHHRINPYLKVIDTPSVALQDPYEANNVLLNMFHRHIQDGEEVSQEHKSHVPQQKPIDYDTVLDGCQVVAFVISGEDLLDPRQKPKMRELCLRFCSYLRTLYNPKVLPEEASDAGFSTKRVWILTHTSRAVANGYSEQDLKQLTRSLIDGSSESTDPVFLIDCCEPVVPNWKTPEELRLSPADVVLRDVTGHGGCTPLLRNQGAEWTALSILDEIYTLCQEAVRERLRRVQGTRGRRLSPRDENVGEESITVRTFILQLYSGQEADLKQELHVIVKYFTDRGLFNLAALRASRGTRPFWEVVESRKTVPRTVRDGIMAWVNGEMTLSETHSFFQRAAVH
ncbi:uncharacterized protein LOC135811997 [Sycon ciliatum]|uniref:uncharacterized protein LOC135811997 n=1 Tax=Sycon ciliatum TaxID=27933 RepID=UPI0031F6459C